MLQDLSGASATLYGQIAERHQLQFNVPIATVRKDPTVTALIALNGAFAFNLGVRLDSLNAHVSIQRLQNQSTDKVRFEFPDGMSADSLLQLLPAVSKEFPSFVQAEVVEKLLGSEIAEFYRAREGALLRLESLAQKMIEDTDRYRQKLDERLATEHTRLASETAELRLRQTEEHDARAKQLDGRDEDLNQRAKELDDRDSRHARRALRQDLAAGAWRARQAVRVDRWHGCKTQASTCALLAPADGGRHVDWDHDHRAVGGRHTTLRPQSASASGSRV